MGVKIMATIAVGTAAAVYGIAKLRDTSQAATNAINGTAGAGAKAGVTLGKLANAFRVVRSGAGAVTGSSPVQNFRSALFGRNNGSLNSLFFRSTPGGNMRDPHTLQEIHAAETLAARAKSEVIALQNAVMGLTGAMREAARQDVRTAKIAWIHAHDRSRVMRDEYNEAKRNRNLHQQNTRMSIAGTNAMVGVAREARNWYRLLFGSINTGSRSAVRGMKAVAAATTTVRVSAQKAKESYSSLGAMFAGTLAALGGTALLSGSTGIFSRAFDLSRHKEDAKTTFDTLLGSRKLTDELTGRVYKYAAATPFQTADILAASQNLMSITGNDVDKNEHLYKLAAKMAALRPGTSVEDASQAILRATFGEFDPLKTFTIQANASMFKRYGDAGGKEYADAVIERIETQFSEKTGGRDIVAALSKTMSGLMSTIKDSLDIPLGKIGDKLISGLGIKEVMIGYITQATYFGDYFSGLVSGKTEVKHGHRGKVQGDSRMESGVKALADMVYGAVLRVIKVGKTLIQWASTAWAWFNSLGKSIQSAMLGGAVGMATFTTAIGIITPLFAGLVAITGILWEPIAMLVGIIGEFGAVAALTIGAVVTPLVLGASFAFMLFRKEGESLSGTLGRLGGYALAGLTTAWESLTAVMTAMWNVLEPALLPAWKRIEAAFGSIRPYFVEILSLMGGTTLSAGNLADIGVTLGNVLVSVMDSSVLLIENGLKGIHTVMEFLRPSFGHMISDFKLMGKTVVEFIGGAASARTTMKTLFYGMVDVVTVPFRIIITKLIDGVSRALYSASAIVRPFSSMVADMLANAGASAVAASNQVMEGFLQTRKDLLGSDSSLHIKLTGDVSASVPVVLNLDGERVAESQARVGMRARNSGRGGDPMTPEEMGFVINDGRIRTVDMSAVSTSAAGGG